MRRWCAATIALATAAAIGTTAAAVAQEGDSADKTLRIARTATPPVIDGRPDDAVWQTAPLIDDFHQIRPSDGGEPSERTEVRLLYDDDYLYIGVRLYDSEPDRITRNVMRHGNALGQDDRLAIVIDPFNTGRNGYRFETNANGVRHDMLYTNTSELQRDWTVIWETQSNIDESGWSFEMAIPFKSLPFNPSVETWGFNFARGIRRRGEEVVWVSRNRTYNPNIVGHVNGFSGMNQGAGLDVVTSASANQRRTLSDDPARPDSSESDGEPSLDVFYRLTPSLNASLTVNTDFSATEIDDRQVNLTRFNLFFPEKRDFFLNDSDLFEFGRIGRSTNSATPQSSVQSGRPYFSRRLGLSPTGEPVDIEYGGKLSGRVGRFSIGTLAVNQDDFELNPGTPNASTVEAKTLFISRIAGDVLDESTLGMIFTDGDPVSNVDNSLAGIDFQYLNTRLPGDRTLEAEAWYQQTDTPGLYGEDHAYGLGINVPNAEGWRGGVSLKELGSNYRPALGFVSRTGVVDYLAQLGYTHFVAGGDFLQTISAGVDAERVNFIAGGLETETVLVRPLDLESRTRDYFRLVVKSNKEFVEDAFTIYNDPTRPDPVQIQPGYYEFDEAGFDLGSGPQRNFSASVVYREGGFYDGDRTNVLGEVNWKPSPRFNMRFRYDWNDIVVSDGAFTSRLFQVVTEVAIRLNLTWINLVQYDNNSEVLGVNSRLHWIPKAGREGFIVLNHNVQDYDKDNEFHSALSDLNVKFSYTFRF